jgi:hypothetical protein
MFEQFFHKPFWITLAFLAGFFGISVMTFQTSFVLALLFVTGVLIFVLTWKRLDLGVTVAFAELFANSHGHLLSTSFGGFSLSLRMVVFLSVLSAWFFLCITKKVSFSFRDKRFIPFIPLIVAAFLGLGIGFLRNNPVKVFQDGNAYFYLAYLLPVLSVSWNGEKKRVLLQVLTASATWVGIMTLGLLFIFTHFPEWVLGHVYTFIRDTRTGELTKMTGNLFRIFLQAQLSVVLIGFLLIPFFWMKKMIGKERLWMMGMLGFFLSVLVISLSRSFWVGAATGGFVFLFCLFRYHKLNSLREVGSKLGMIIGAGFFSIILLVGIILFPYPYRIGSTSAFSSLFSSRATDVSDVAVSSRWKLLPAMWNHIEEHPIFGNGFGQEVEFQTDDPRVRAFSPDGTWRTYALEWGWLELWLKMGILGPLAFLFLFGNLVYGLRPYVSGRIQPSWMGIGFLSGLVAVYAMHIFSPYLNHPLGLGFLIFLVPFLVSQPTLIKETDSEKEKTIAASFGNPQPSFPMREESL